MTEINKKAFLLLMVFCQLFFFAKDKNDHPIYIDSSIHELTITTDKLNQQSYHLFSHGRSGELFIEDQWLNANEIAIKFKNQLKDKTELYIYGCNFAQDEKGIAAVKFLEKTLNVKVSASTNITGIDGDWILETGNGRNAIKSIIYDGNLQLGTTHYLNPIVSAKYDDTSISEEFIYLSTPSTTSISVKMTFATEIGSPRVSVTNLNGGAISYISNGVLTLDNANPIRLQFVTNANVVIPPGNTAITVPLLKAGTVLNGAGEGLKFISTDNYFVNYRARSTPQAGSVISKGFSALGKEFRWGGSPIEFLTTTVPELGNTLSVMATENNTKIIISNIKSGTKFINGNSGTTLVGPSISRTLNKGESFILYAPVTVGGSIAQENGWLGAKVLSDKDITVVVGGLLQQGNAPNDRDIAIVQLVPVSRLGLEHVVMQGNGLTREKAIVVATEDNTDVFVNGSATKFTTLALAGDYALIPAANFNANKNMFIRVTKPSYTFHKVYGNNQDNTNSLMFIPPLSCFGQNTVDLIPDSRKIGSTVYAGTEIAVLVAKGAANIPSVKENGTALTPFASAGVVNGNTNWLTYRYNLTAATSNIKVSSQGPIQVELIGASGVAGYGSYYSGFGNTPIYNIMLSTPYDYPCAGNSTLSLPIISNATFQWYKNNLAIAGATNSSYVMNPITDSTPATYYAIVSFPGGCTVRSNQLTSETCPCPKPGATGTPDSYTKVGISIRDKNSTTNWPTDIPNGFITMESNSKGFVITRMETPENSINDPRAGMLVYDTTEDCLKLYDGTGWKCIKQTCND